MTRIDCDGCGCREWVSKDEQRQRGWTIVLISPLLNDESDVRRRFLCRICSRRHLGLFKS